MAGDYFICHYCAENSSEVLMVVYKGVVHMQGVF